jgi:molybdopterin-guanine dinucleotide biosynthesis protein A
MGRDKAALPYAGGTLLEYVAEQVRMAAGCVTVVGGGDRQGLRVVEDLYPEFGPLGGILTALRDTESAYALVVACDMPGITAELLRGLLDAAVAERADAVVAQGPDGRIHPLCACYSRAAASEIQRCVEAGVHAVQDALRGLRTIRLEMSDARALANVNTPDEWEKAAGRQR